MEVAREELETDPASEDRGSLRGMPCFCGASSNRIDERDSSFQSAGAGRSTGIYEGPPGLHQPSGSRISGD